MSELSWGFQLDVLWRHLLEGEVLGHVCGFHPEYCVDAHVYRYSSSTVFIYMGFNKNQLRT
jgi:hypothetical protein